MKASTEKSTPNPASKWLRPVVMAVQSGTAETSRNISYAETLLTTPKPSLQHHRPRKILSRSLSQAEITKNSNWDETRSRTTSISCNTPVTPQASSSSSGSEPTEITSGRKWNGACSSGSSATKQIDQSMLRMFLKKKTKTELMKRPELDLTLQAESSKTVPDQALDTGTRKQSRNELPVPETGDSGLRLTSPYIVCHKLLDDLFVGNLDMAMNRPFLCRYNIEWMIDAGTTTDTPRIPVSKLPCLCSASGRPKHSWNELRLELNENVGAREIVQCFDEVNRFIGAAKNHTKKVLIFSCDGENSAQALALQYLMFNKGIKLGNARAFVQQQTNFSLRLTQNYEHALEIWQSHLHKKQITDNVTETSSVHSEQSANRPQSRYSEQRAPERPDKGKPRKAW